MPNSTPKNDAASGFAALGLGKQLLSVLDELGYEEPTPIQQAAIAPLVEGRDLLGQAATGTGKTAAFALPLLQRLPPTSRGKRATFGLVLVPTRELAMQVAEAMHRYGRHLGVAVTPIYGGQSIGQQFRTLSRGVDVVVATPGRALDHIRRGTLDLASVQVVVLDEADEMLDMGFADDLEAILEAVPKKRQTALFSATMPKRIATIADRHLKNPVRVNIQQEKMAKGSVPQIRQRAYIVPRAQKLAALGRILDMESPQAALVFCRTRTEVDQLTQSLVGRGFSAEALHGGLSQQQRDRVMKRFRDGTVQLVLATDVAARGLDIENLSHVVNFDVPSNAEAYVHRIGRTGRAGREGVAITLAEPREQRLVRNIEQLTRQRIEICIVPSAEDLRTRRLDLTRAALLKALQEGRLEPFRSVVESLGDEFDVLDIAAAAVKLVHEAGERDGEDAEFAAQERTKPSRTDRERAPREKTPRAGARSPREEAPTRPAPRPRVVTPLPDGVKVYVSAGATANVRPADLVGAITGEAGIEGSAIGAIQIEDRYSIVEVQGTVADKVLDALSGASIRGQKVTVSRYNEKKDKKKKKA